MKKIEEPAAQTLSFRQGLTLLLLGCSVSVLSALALPSPGYVDAEYYFVTGRRIAAGEGFSEPFLWNYLDDPTGLPHPSHHYWMPLTSIMSASGIWFFGESFRAAQFGFILLTSALPLITALLALRIHGNATLAYQSGLLAALPGFFLPYFVTTDTFSPFAVFGCLSLLLMARARFRRGQRLWFMAGCAIALAHLTRADGLLLFVPALLALWGKRKEFFPSIGAVILGYGLVMGPWWARNVSVFGSIFPPGSMRTLYQQTYDDLFDYPASRLTFQYWIEAGMGSILSARFSALWINFQRLIAENGLIFLGPFMLLGTRRLWEDLLVRLTVAYLLTLFLVMSLIFPFAGARGGFFHSSAAVMPVLWALAPVGLRDAVAWGAKKRGWVTSSAQRVFTPAMLIMALMLTAGLFASKVFGPPRWGGSLQRYTRLGEKFSRLRADPGIVVVNNPPGFYLATGMPAIVVPDGDTQTLNNLVHSYDAMWVVLDENHPSGLKALYESPDAFPQFDFVDRVQFQTGKPMLIFNVTDLEQE